MLLEEYTQQALAIYAFPCPPLPLLALRGEDGDTDVVSSHDLLLTGMGFSRRKRREALEAQMQGQTALLAAYSAELDAIHASGADVESLYAALQSYTRRTVGLYLEKDPADVDARFAPLDCVSRGDLVHQRAAEHLSLHHSMCTGRELPLEGLLALSYPDLLRQFLRLHCAESGSI